MNWKIAALAIGVSSCLSLHGTTWFVNAAQTSTKADGTQAFPFSTIQLAMNKVKAGDTVIVAQGVYREHLRIMQRQWDKLVTLKAAPGAHPVISGFQEVKNWKLGKDGLYRTTIGYFPRGLLVNGEYLQLARLPESGWLRMKHAGGYSFTTDAKYDVPAGTNCYIWIAWGNVFDPIKLKSARPGHYELVKPWFRMSQHEKSPDRCFFVNHPALIRKSGQWAWKQLAKNQYEVYLKLDAPLNKSRIQIGGALPTLTIRGVDNLLVSGIDLCGSAVDGMNLTGSKKVTIRNMGIYWSRYRGVWLRGCDGTKLENMRIVGNAGGISSLDNQNITIRGCDIGNNFEDGLTITWRSKNILVENNRIHNQVSWGHPDNIQMYRRVDNVIFRNNILFCGGQGLMAEQVGKITLENNLIVGTDAVAVIWGHNSCFDIVMKKNTVLFGGWGEISISGKNFNFSENILMGNEFSQQAKKSHAYVGTGNHFITDGNYWFGKHNNLFIRTFDNYVRMAGETDFTRQKLPVKGMPQAMTVIASNYIAECSEDTFVVRADGASKFAVGDILEINCDRIPRTVTKTTENTISFTPALKNRPLHAYIVLNWKNQKDLVWNPQFTSQAGSTVPFKALREDACPSVPMPPNVQRFIDDMARLIPPAKF